MKNRINFMLNKKGELTTQYIVILIVLILSFAVILFFLFKLNLGSESEKEICHNSVVTRGVSVIPSESVPLNCRRDYVCLSEDGSCDELVGPRVEKVKSVEDIYSALANEMADCWWMFGEGKIDYVGDKATEKNYCSICSQVSFDNSVSEIEGLEGGTISKDEFYKYLSENKISGGEKTYSEYLFRTNDVEELKRQVAVSQGNFEGIPTFGEIKLDETYFSVMGITSEIGNTYKWIGGAVVVASLFTPIGWTATAVVIAGGTTAIVAGEEIAGNIFNPEVVGITLEGEGVKNRFLAPTIVEADSDKFELLNCADITTLA